MASYLRPRRGKEATAKSQNIVLKRGEIFFETPASGVGTGIGRLKMGDGSTSYASLPYFLRQLDLSDNNTKCAFTNATAATASSNNATYLNNIAPTNSLKTVFHNIKQLLLNYNSQLTSLNNDLGNKQPKGNYQPAGSYAAANHNHNGVYQPAGSYAAANHNHNGVYQPAGSYASTTDTSNIWNAINNTDKLKIVVSGGTYTTIPQRDRQVTISVKEPYGGTCIAEIPVIDNSGIGAVGISVGRNFNQAHTIILYSNRQSQSDVIVYLYSFYRM
jgi:hypothetical protein